MDVFPRELPRTPPPREVDFSIELIPGQLPFQLPPYWMAPAELKELQIRPRNYSKRGSLSLVFPRGEAPVLSVKKRTEPRNLVLTPDS